MKNSPQLGVIVAVFASALLASHLVLSSVTPASASTGKAVDGATAQIKDVATLQRSERAEVRQAATPNTISQRGDEKLDTEDLYEVSGMDDTEEGSDDYLLTGSSINDTLAQYPEYPVERPL